MKPNNRSFPSIVILIMTALLLTACGDKVTYRVTGKDISTAKIEYNDTNGNRQKEQVDLPWEKTIGIEEGFDAVLFVTNLESTGEVTCGILLNDNELGQASSAINVQCFVFEIHIGEEEYSFLNPFLGMTIEGMLEQTQNLVEKGSLEKALEYANTAIEAAPDYAGCYTNRAIVYEELGDLQAAKADLLKATELSDDPELLKWVDDKLSEY